MHRVLKNNPITVRRGHKRHHSYIHDSGQKRSSNTEENADFGGLMSNTETNKQWV